jgi:hypothetical protein
VIAAAAPVQRVVITDREPQGSPWKAERTWLREETGWVDRPEESCLLPPQVFDLLEPDALDLGMLDYARNYKSDKLAREVLSNACLARARVLAGGQHCSLAVQ